MAQENSTHATSEQLRDAIDRGQGGSKVPWPDPAAAPLGTDEEAAGTRLAPQAIQTAHEQEARSPYAHAARPGAGGTAVAPPPRRTLVVVGALLLLSAVLAIWFAFAVP